MFDLGNWMFVFVRAGALLAVLPFFSTQNFPVLIRVALGAILAVLVSPLLPPFPLDQHSFGSLLELFLMEISVGLLLGFSCRMVFFAIDLAGGIISTEMGLMLPPQYNPFASG